MRVGNDIVDLGDSEALFKASDSRFMMRVFEDREILRIRRAQRPDRQLWAQWAAKEAAYKALGRGLQTRLVFAHSKFQTELDDVSMATIAFGCVNYEGVRLSLRVDFTDDWVHAIAGDDVRNVPWSVETKPHKADASTFVRASLLQATAARLDTSVDRLSIDRIPFGEAPAAPTLALDGDPLSLTFSLSHHGRYVAWAAEASLRTPASWL